MISNVKSLKNYPSHLNTIQPWSFDGGGQVRQGKFRVTPGREANEGERRARVPSLGALRQWVKESESESR